MFKRLINEDSSTCNWLKVQKFQDNVSIDSWQCRMEIDKVKSMKTAKCAIGSKCKSFQSRGHCYDKKSERVGNSASTQLVGSCQDKKSDRVGSSASTQLVGSCHDEKSKRVGNSASTQLMGSCHDKKSERVGNRASTQLVGSCHDEKSEQAGCIASTQQDSTFQLIVGFKADSDFSDI